MFDNAGRTIEGLTSHGHSWLGKNFLNVSQVLAAPAITHYTKIAVYDVGSNSVRLTIFEFSNKKPTVIYNKKEVCELGKGMINGNRNLNPDGKEHALAVLEEFSTIVAKENVDFVIPICTAAIRMAEDKIFNNKVKRAIGYDLNIVTSIQESIISLLGLLYGMPNAHGLCFGIGGRSAHHGKVVKGHIDYKSLGELQTGMLALAEESGGDPKKIPEILKKYMSIDDPNFHMEDGILYGVGGAIRDLGRISYEWLIGGPVYKNSEHGYIFERGPEIDAILQEMQEPTRTGKKRVERIAEAVPKDKFDEWVKAHKSREKTRPIAAAVLVHILNASKAESFIVSKHGLPYGAIAQAGFVKAGLALG